MNKTRVSLTQKASVKILELLRQDKKLTIPQLTKQTGITTRAIEKNTRKLQEEGILKRVGPGKGGRRES